MKELSRVINTAFVSCLGLGFFPRGPGTLTSLVAAGFWVGLLHVIPNQGYLVLLCAFLCAIGAWAIESYCLRTKQKDPSEVVIDEWVGMGLSLALVKNSLADVCVAFLLFRLFDIWKPPGVRYFDRRFLKGWGVMLDDVVAGFYVCICFGIYRWIILPLL